MQPAGVSQWCKFMQQNWAWICWRSNLSSTVPEVKAVNELLKCDHEFLVRSSASDLHDCEHQHQMHKPAEDLVASQIVAGVTSNEQPLACDHEGSNSRSDQEQEPVAAVHRLINKNWWCSTYGRSIECSLQSIFKRSASSCVPEKTNVHLSCASAAARVNDESFVINLSPVTEVHISTGKAVSNCSKWLYIHRKCSLSSYWWMWWCQNREVICCW